MHFSVDGELLIDEVNLGQSLYVICRGIGGPRPNPPVVTVDSGIATINNTILQGENTVLSVYKLSDLKSDSTVTCTVNNNISAPIIKWANPVKGEFII